MNLLLGLWEYILLFLLASIPWIEILVVIPIGIVWGLPAIPVAVVSLLGNLLTVLLVIFLFEKWDIKRKKKRELKQREKWLTQASMTGKIIDEPLVDAVPPLEPIKTSQRKNRAKKIFHKYGLPGLALTGPLITGTHLATIMALFAKPPRNSIVYWMTLSLVLWTVAITMISVYGFDLFT